MATADQTGQPVGETATWTFGSIAAGGQAYFVVATLPGATTYRITVAAFDRVSREELPAGAPGAQSP